ncbi:nuclear transport factor 2 family protein [Paraburkholderia sp. IMGN_8]|uniref:nuclear transport factor 2 family protein n=1 Tax=Paraburkholderia sp. IMGN_8 TaxID=3136564 RepID=UPI003100B686
MARNVEPMFSAIDAMDVEGFLSNLAENVTFQFGNAPALVGREAVREGVVAFFSSIAALRHEMTGKWEADEITILRFMTYYTRHDHNEVEVPCAVILHHAENTLIDDYRIYIDLAPVFAPPVGGEQVAAAH